MRNWSVFVGVAARALVHCRCMVVGHMVVLHRRSCFGEFPVSLSPTWSVGVFFLSHGTFVVETMFTFFSFALRVCVRARELVANIYLPWFGLIGVCTSACECSAGFECILVRSGSHLSEVLILLISVLCVGFEG